MSKKKLAILGNCQIFAIQSYLISNDLFSKDWEIVSIPPVFQLSNGYEVLDQLRSVDCIASQPFFLQLVA